MKYRKLPVEIEAFIWTGGPDQEEDPAWICSKLRDGTVRIHNIPDNGIHMAIETLEGVMIARPGDYIIKGVKGEVYPCKPDIFEMTYEKVTHN